VARASAIPLLSCILLGPVLAAGCFFPLYEAEVPAVYLTDGWDPTGRERGGSWLGEGMRWSQVTYQVVPADDLLDRGPYPASLMVMSIDTPVPLDTADVIANLEEQVRMNAAAEGVVLREATRRSGDRVLANTVHSTWFTYDARISSESSLFTPGRDAKVHGEAFFDGRSKITVVAVGLAQVQGGTVAGQYHRDDTHWRRIVADPDATIVTPAASDGLVYNVRSHGS
jgi:hypothetical protein